MKFQSSVPGQVMGVRFYKGSQNTGTHVGRLWSRTGALLATVTFSNETSSGWQQANFSSPVAINANTTYVISYRAPNGRYSANTGYFSNSVTNGPLTALRNGQDGSNGVYKYGSTGFPTSTWYSCNYWVDVVFRPSTSTAAPTSMSMSGMETRLLQSDSGSLVCSPKSVQAGDSFTCEVSDASEPVELNVDGSSDVMLPAVTAARRDQRSVSFRGSVAPGASRQSITISAGRRGQRLEDTITMLPSSAPAITVPPDQLVKHGAPVAFKVSTDSPDSVVLSVADLPPGALFEASTGQFEWTPTVNQQGVYDVKFTAKSPAGAVTETVQFVVDAGVPLIDKNSLRACSPGAIATITGKWLGPNDPVIDNSGSSLQIGGTSVRVNGALVPVLHAHKTRVSFVCPAGQPGDKLLILAETSSGSTELLHTIMRAANPVLLTADDSSQGLIFHSDTSQMAMVRDVRSAGQPAQPGDSLTIRATGFGNGNSSLVKIGGVYAEILSVGPSIDEAGIWEIRVTVPSALELGDTVPVQLEIPSPEGQLVSNTVTIAVESVRP
jgi:uncharacterized protein (TIGR03437 family)